MHTTTACKITHWYGGCRERDAWHPEAQRREQVTCPSCLAVLASDRRFVVYVRGAESAGLDGAMKQVPHGPEPRRDHGLRLSVPIIPPGETS